VVASGRADVRRSSSTTLTGRPSRRTSIAVGAPAGRLPFRRS
jgi:hypothetical protein